VGRQKDACPPYVFSLSDQYAKCFILAMSNYRRDYTPGATYFFTVVTYRRRSFLCDEDVRNALRDAIQLTRENYPFVIEAWVLLPDHLHCIWKLPPSDADHSIRWKLIKRRVTGICGPCLHIKEWMTVSKTKHRESTLWQRRHIEHRIRDDRDFSNHCDYIHYNPVKHGLVNCPVDWPYSSFHRFIKLRPTNAAYRVKN
jgi:putative transposase